MNNLNFEKGHLFLSFSYWCECALHMISTICTRSGDSLELKVPEFVKTLYGVCTQDLRKFQGSNHLYTYYTSLMVDLDLCQDINRVS